MRNKNTLKQSLLLAAILPFLAFSVVLANHGADDEDEAHLETSTEVKSRIELRQQNRVELKDAREAKREDRQELRQEHRSNRRSIVATNIKSIMESQIARATKALDRLSLILDKIEAKSKDMPAGSDMTQVNASITKAKAQEAAIKVAIEKARADFEILAETKVEETSDDQPSTAQPVRAAKQAVVLYMSSIKDVKRKLIDFHKTLKDTVKIMRSAAKAVESDSTEIEVESSVNSSTPNN